MATLLDIRERVQRILADPSGAQYTQDLLNDGIVAALEAILPWVSKTAVEQFEGDDETVEFELPADVYRINAVFDTEKGVYIPQNILSVGRNPGFDIESNNDWLEYPEGSLSLANAPTSDGQIILYYSATWTAPTDDDDAIEAPVYTHRAITFYAASYALLEKASSSSNIRQWNVQVDSGTPIMNPMRDASEHLYKRFLAEMERIPARLRGVHG